MRIFITIFLAFILMNTNLSRGCQLQPLINLNKELTQKGDDPLNGPQKDFYPNGRIMKEYILKDGLIEGSYKFYNILGKLVSDQQFKDGIPNGYLKTYYENGQLKAEMNMIGASISGSSKEYDSDGTLRKESMISGEAPEISSQTTTYFKNGKKQSEITVANGKFVYSIKYDDQGRVTFEDKPGQSISYSYDRDGKRYVSINGVPQK